MFDLLTLFVIGVGLTSLTLALLDYIFSGKKKVNVEIV
jgi:hypothetical protein